MHEKKLDVLEGAIENVCGDRHKDYGDSLVNHTRIANLWNTWITGREWSGKPLTAYDVAMMMSLFKHARAASNKAHADNFVDAIGYLALASEMTKG